MYIWDALYGKIEFTSLIYKCILSPEVQRLREVRLCNINSLCITGSSNINRYEHSIGTAYLAKINIESDNQKHLNLQKQEKEIFITAALLHDVANGPFGHSYEYIMEKQGFMPEKGLADVFADLVSTGSGGHKISSPFESIYFGKLRGLRTILTDSQKTEVTKIVSGEHMLSSLVSSPIDLDNIDNVFRMAYHMGLSFSKEAPIKLAEMMFLLNGKIVFSQDAKPYLIEWFNTRQKVYKFLLLNPQEFSGKYMLTEAMDILFECITQDKARNYDIKWYFTDYELMKKLGELTEVWLPRKTFLVGGIDTKYLHQLLSNEDQAIKKSELKSLIESLILTSPIKLKGKSGNSKTLQLNDNFTFDHQSNDVLTIRDRNMSFEINNGKLYKVTLTRYNPSQIVSRLMTGDLYDCLTIIQTKDIEKYRGFLDYSNRLIIEDELDAIIRSYDAFSNLSVGLHPILDLNKTERQLEITFENDTHTTTIGNISSKKLLIGVFLKNEPYGLKHGKIALAKNRDLLTSIVLEYFTSYFEDGANTVPLYKEADEYGS